MLLLSLQPLTHSQRMKKLSKILRKCRTLSGIGKSSSHNTPRSKSTREERWDEMIEGEPQEVVFVGSSRRPYMINSKLLNHPLMNALIKKSKQKGGDISVNCEVVIFDHLLWMLENNNQNFTMDSLEELAQLYAC
ncbi:hypothetical protein MRB53_024633 [Persea americana]|uniref:Uncharacterized protein n=1 Tax=Persea americana TaxID=3435 RepID=A0ACC2LDH1_PERAE|nr:hypothetical protein MRB53_024633 [Persea americana]